MTVSTLEERRTPFPSLFHLFHSSSASHHSDSTFNLIRPTSFRRHEGLVPSRSLRRPPTQHTKSRPGLLTTDGSSHSRSTTCLNPNRVLARGSSGRSLTINHPPRQAQRYPPLSRSTNIESIMFMPTLSRSPLPRFSPCPTLPRPRHHLLIIDEHHSPHQARRAHIYHFSHLWMSTLHR